MVKARVLTKVNSATVGPMTPGMARWLNSGSVRLMKGGRPGGHPAKCPGPDVPKKPLVPAYSLHRPGIEPTVINDICENASFYHRAINATKAVRNNN